MVLLSELPLSLIQLPISTTGLLRRTSSAFRNSNETMHASLKSFFANSEGHSLDTLETAAKRYFALRDQPAIGAEHGIFQTALLAHVFNLCFGWTNDYDLLDNLRAKSKLLGFQQGRGVLLNTIVDWMRTAALTANVDPAAYEIKRAFFAHASDCLMTQHVLLEDGTVGI